MPVTPQTAVAESGASNWPNANVSRPAQRHRSTDQEVTHRFMNFSNFFIRRPIFAGVLSAVIFIVGLLAMWRLPISEYPEVVPPTIVVQRTYPGRQSQNHRRNGGLAAGTGHQRRGGFALHVFASHRRRRDGADRHVQTRHRRRQGPGAGAEPRFPGVAKIARGSARGSASPPPNNRRI